MSPLLSHSGRRQDRLHQLRRVLLYARAVRKLAARPLDGQPLDAALRFKCVQLPAKRLQQFQ